MKWIQRQQINTTHELLEYGAIFAQVLFSRGINTKAEAEKYLHPTLEQLPSTKLMPNIAAAVKLIIATVKTGQKIIIYGDYDVDGISSTAIIFDFLYRYLGANIAPYIPNRFEEGYGLNKQALESILAQDTKLVITVDCGIKDAELINEFHARGLNFIVTDHHALPDSTLNFVKDIPIVHPAIPGNKYPNSDICATNVAWKLVCELYLAAQKQTGLLKQDLDVNKYLDLVALATVCDVMPLINENRIIVKFGLEQLRNTVNPGLKEILISNKLDLNQLDAYHFGFVLGPRLNAAGRMEDALIGLKLLSSQDEKVIPALANRLEMLNRERQAMTAKYLTEAELQVTEQLKAKKKLLFIIGQGWSEGIIGLVAGKLTEKYHLPVIAAAVNKPLVKGSARSIKGYNITDAITKGKELLQRFGGHSQAAGFTLEEKDLEQFIKLLQNDAEENIDNLMLEKVLEIDADFADENLNLGFAKQLYNYKPFGFGNSTPTFRLTGLNLLKMSLLGKEKQHFKIQAKTKTGIFINAIAFNKPEFSAIIGNNKQIDLVFNLDINVWNGQETLQLNIKDLKLSGNND